MKKSAWKKRIISQMETAGTYKPAFDSVIETLAMILEHRDAAYQQFVESGGEVCIIKTSDRGAKNIAKNPRLQVWQDLNNTALAYWRECCLSPAALRKISAEVMSGNTDTGSVLDALLKKITDE